MEIMYDEMKKSIASLTSAKCSVIDTNLTGAIDMISILIIHKEFDEYDLDLINDMIRRAENYLDKHGDCFDVSFIINKRDQINSVRVLLEEVAKMIKKINE